MASGEGGGAALAQARIQRQFVQTSGSSTGSSSSGSSFRVLQWNLLADGLAQHGDFVRVKPEVLEWSYRKPLILAEVQQAQADILCLQELNYYDELAAELARSGYQGCFLAKQRSAALKYSSPADGIAIFWRADRFQVSSQPQGFYFLDSTGAEYPQGCMHVLLTDRHSGAGAPSSSSASPSAPPPAPQRQLLVATTHLKAKEGADLERIRLQQVQQLLGHVKDAVGAAAPSSNSSAPASDASTNGASASQHHAASPTAVPVVVAGDFNTVPGSAPCRVLATPPWSLQSIWDVPAAQGAEGNQPAPATPQQPENGAAAAAAAAARRSSPAPEFSTWKFRSGGESKRVIDHVWFTQGPGGLRVKQRWRMLDEEEIGPAGLPCSAYPSDHLALCAEFEWV